METGLHLACHRLGSAGSQPRRAEYSPLRRNPHPRSRLFPYPLLESGHRCDSFFSPARRSSPLAALAVSYGSLNRLSHCSINRTFPGLGELVTWHPLPGWNVACPPILKFSVRLGRTIDVNCASLDCVGERITNRQQQRASSAVRSLWPLLTIGGLLI